STSSAGSNSPTAVTVRYSGSSPPAPRTSSRGSGGSDVRSTTWATCARRSSRRLACQVPRYTNSTTSPRASRWPAIHLGVSRTRGIRLASEQGAVERHGQEQQPQVGHRVLVEGQGRDAVHRLSGPHHPEHGGDPHRQNDVEDERGDEVRGTELAEEE